MLVPVAGITGRYLGVNFPAARSFLIVDGFIKLGFSGL